VKREAITNNTNPIKNLPTLVKQVNSALSQPNKNKQKSKYIVKDSQGYYIM
jgi:predicted transcriptional regulator